MFPRLRQRLKKFRKNFTQGSRCPPPPPNIETKMSFNSITFVSNCVKIYILVKIYEDANTQTSYHKPQFSVYMKVQQILVIRKEWDHAEDEV